MTRATVGEVSFNTGQVILKEKFANEIIKLTSN